jgi:hypothetical protein
MRQKNRTNEIATETVFREQQLCSSSSFSGNGQWHSSLLLVMMTIMLVAVLTIVMVDVMLVTMMIMDHLLLLLTAS